VLRTKHEGHGTGLGEHFEGLKAEPRMLPLGAEHSGTDWHLIRTLEFGSSRTKNTNNNKRWTGGGTRTASIEHHPFRGNSQRAAVERMLSWRMLAGGVLRRFSRAPYTKSSTNKVVASPQTACHSSDPPPTLLAAPQVHALLHVSPLLLELVPDLHLQSELQKKDAAKRWGMHWGKRWGVFASLQAEEGRKNPGNFKPSIGSSHRRTVPGKILPVKPAVRILRVCYNTLGENWPTGHLRCWHHQEPPYFSPASLGRQAQIGQGDSINLRVANQARAAG